MTIYATANTLAELLDIVDMESIRAGTPVYVQKVNGTDVNWATEPYIVTVSSGHKVRIYHDVAHVVEVDDNGDTSINPNPSGSSGDTLALDGIAITATDGSLESASATLTLTLGGGAVTSGTPPSPISMTPTANSTDVPIGTDPMIATDQYLYAGTGTITLRNVTDGTDIETLTVPDDIGAGNYAPGSITLEGAGFTFSPTADLPNGKQVGLRWTSGVFTNASSDLLAAVTDDTWSFTTAAAVPGSTLPAPTQTSFWFDHQSVTYDTTTNCATFAAILTAWKAAMEDPGTVGSPKYHDIVYTGGNITGAQTLTFTVTDPGVDTVFIRIRPATPFTRFTGTFIVATGPKYALWYQWTFDADVETYVNNGPKATIFLLNNGTAANYMAWDDCDIGVYWRGITTPSSYPEFISGSGAANSRLSIKNCRAWRVFQLLGGRSGYHHLHNNFILELIDDVSAQTVLNAVPFLSYTYATRNVVARMADDPAYSGYHTDFGQTGTGADVSSDAYYNEWFENIYIGDSYQQYATNGFLFQTGGPAANFTQTCHDNVILCTGWRGAQFSDKRTDLQRFFAAWPPLAGPIPSTGTGWNGGPPRPQLWFGANTANGASNTPTLDYVACDDVRDNAGWGVTPTNYNRMRPTLAHGTGNPQAYDEIFTDMTGMSYSGGQTRIDPVASGYVAAVDAAIAARDPQPIRDWVSSKYIPTFSGTKGWTENGYTDPAGWHD